MMRLVTSKGVHIDRYSFSHNKYNGRSATKRYLLTLGSIHDIDCYYGIDNGLALNTQVLLSHWGHLSIIILWLTGNIFHIGWNGNYELWIRNPISTIPIAHGIWDPHFGLSISDAYASGGSDYAVILCYSGIYNWLYACGFNSVFQLYNLVIFGQILAVVSLVLGKLHIIYLEDLLWHASESGYVLATELEEETTKVYKTLALDRPSGQLFIWPLRLILACFDSSGLRLNFHIGVLIGFSSILWSAHLIHVAIPSSRGINVTWTTLNLQPSNYSLYALYTGDWIKYSLGSDVYHIYGSNVQSNAAEPQAILTFIGGLRSDTASLHLTDMAHHHLAIGVLFVWAGHLYKSLYKGIGHRLRDILFLSGNSAATLSSVAKSLHLQLSLALAGISVLTSVVAQHGYSLTAYPYLSYDYVQSTALYVHHSWIASLLMMGCFAHAGIYLLRDYHLNPLVPGIDPVARILSHKAGVISKLSWVCLWLGFHSLGLYIHNDTVVAFGEPEKQLQIEPVFAQVIQGSSGKDLYAIGCLDALPNNDLSNYTGGLQTTSLDSLLLPIGPGDLLVHHAIALGLHVTVLILLKGSLDARGSKLMPDKIQFGFGFSCDGPGRGGTCDISAWDSFYLATFWMLNTNAWVIFYFHWKFITLSTPFQFDEASTYLNGWFRDYLWFYSASLIRGYDSSGVNELSVWIWLFLAAHLCWATGFMFLISWRGYWQELIDIILYMHMKTPYLYEIWTGALYTPVALSIVQARFIGLVHFAVGFILTYSAFVLAACQ